MFLQSLDLQLWYITAVTSRLPRVLQESLNIQLCSSHISAFHCSIFLMFSQSLDLQLWYITAVTSHLSNIQPYSCFAREPSHTATELSLLSFPMFHLVLCSYRALIYSCGTLTSLPILNGLVRVLQESLYIQLWGSHFSAFVSSTLCFTDSLDLQL